MEKMFIDHESLNSAVADSTTLNDGDHGHSRGGVVSYRCKVYRSLLEQGRAGQPWSMVSNQGGSLQPKEI